MSMTQKDILKARLISIKTRSSSFWLNKLSKYMMDGQFLTKYFLNSFEVEGETINIAALNKLINSIENMELKINEKNLSNLLGDSKNITDFINEMKTIKNFAKTEERESGKNILKIGFPFVSGVLNDGTSFRTPMFFWDLEIIQLEGSNNFLWKIGEKILNHNVISVKTSKANELPNLKFDIEDLNEAIAIYTNNGLDIENFDFEFNKFDDIKKDDLSSVITMSTECVIGCFDVSASRLFDEIDLLDKNGYLETLLESKVDHLFDYQEFVSNFDENDIDYFSDLDLYQQTVVKLAMQQSLVIQGPPGTGKSQVIMNILLNAKANGKKVLFVAEKKTAIDVVYNRMGDLQFTSLFIPSAKEKQSFYEQFNLIADALSFHNKIKVEPKTLEVKALLDAFKNARVMSKANILDRNKNINEIIAEDKTKKVINEIKSNNLQDFDVRKISYNYLNICNEYLSSKNELPVNLTTAQLSELNNATEKLNEAKKDVVYQKYILTGKVEKPGLFDKVKDANIDKISSLKRDISKLQTFNDKYKDFKFDDVVYEANKVFKSTGLTELEIREVFEILHYSKNLSSEIQKTGKVETIVEDIKSKISEDRNKMKYEGSKKILDIYTNNYKDYDNLVRQASAKRFKPMHEFINANYDFLFDLYDIHIATIENVTTFLPLEIEKYDLVVFDEASQIFLEKGLSVIARGKNLVVAGDTKQLKPSLFFETRIEFSGDDSNSNYDIEEATNAESLLDFYATRLQNIMIKGHYRSKYKELIDFSNVEFYDKQLVFVPSSEKWRTPVAVFDVPGVWENGKNIVEAEKIVEMITFLSTQQKIYSKSIGVITFNKEQAEYITNLLVKANNEKINEWMERTIHGEFVGLFVKNIENVQGDERDIIFFSVAYNDKVRNFGPLSQTGGENRLNVAVTRAREQNIVFKSLPASQYYGDTSAQKGPFLFKKWLLFCEKIGKQDVADLSNEGENTLDSFITDVKSKLENQIVSGYTIMTNVKSSIYTMDIVIYRDGRPLLAIDCDGYEKVESDSSRENDLYKRRMLNGRGWSYLKIWKFNWVLNEDKQILKIINIINNIK